MNKDGVKAIFIRSNGSFNRYYQKDPYHTVIQEELTRLYGNAITLPEMVYLFLNDQSRPPLCPSCKTTIPPFISIPRGYREYCTQSACKQANIQAVNLRKYGTPFPSRLKEFQDKAKETNKEKYGVSNPMQNKDVRNKAISSMIEKYGVANPSQSASIQEKKAQNSLDKYGVRSPLMAPEVKERIKESNQRNHGVDYPMQSNEIQNKSKETVRDRYGVDYIVQDAYTQEKIQNTLLERYGTRQYFASEHAKTAIKATNIERYGVLYTLGSKVVYERARQAQIDKFGDIYSRTQKGREECRKGRKLATYRNKKAAYTNIRFEFTEEEYSRNSDQYHEWDLTCLDCGNPFKSFMANGIPPSCPYCNPRTYSSSRMEKEIGEILIGWGHDIQKNVRNVIRPLEIDIYLPEKKIGIEMNGVYWHSDKHQPPSYHKDKMIKCREQGVRLIQIFDDRWNNSRDKVLSRLGSILGNIKTHLHARKCSVEIIEYKEAKEFLDTNHLQGYSSDSIRYGLRHDGRLVGIMTFRKPRFNPSYQWEMIRFCTGKNIRVIGGASRLLSRFIKDHSPENILSYADLCWSEGNLYKQLGFTLIKETEPGYFYVKNGVRVNRMSMTKKKIEEMGGRFDPDMNEEDNAGLNGFLRVYDCGQGVWVRKIRK